MIEIKKEDNFEEQKQNWQKRIAEDAELGKRLTGLLFKPGQKLTLGIEITDDYLSQILFGLLYHSESVKGAENLGFKVTEIAFRPVNTNGIVHELQDLINKIQSGEI